MGLKFDTRDKKPKVYNIAAATALAAVLIFLSLRFAGAQRLPLVSCVLCAFYLTALVLLVRGFFRQLEYNPYSYNTIIYAGFALFVLSVFINHIVVTVQSFAGSLTLSPADLIHMLAGSAKNYMAVTAPFLLVFSVALFISNVALIRHEGRRFVNILGIILSVLLVAGEVFVFLLDRQPGPRSLARELAVNLFAAAYLYFECMLVGAIIADVIAAKYEPEKDKDYIIVLGCGIRKDGKPTPLLRGRLDRALDFAREQIARTGKAPVYIVSGGKEPDEVTSEAASMRDYLLEQGVPPERILMEDRSTDTAENMRFSKEVLYAHNPAGGKVAYATTNYHVFRGGLKARWVKLRAVGMGSDTRWYFWPNAAVREFVGLLTEHRGKQALLILGIAAFYVLMTLADLKML